MTLPQVTVEYQNAWGDTTQVIQLEDSQTAIVSETLYDELGRDALKVKSTKLKRAHDHACIFCYHENFVTNRYPSAANYVFKTGVIEGLAAELNPMDEGYPFYQKLYHNDLLRDIKIQGMPGKAFSVDGTFVKKYERQSGILLLKLLFPPENGFKQKVTHQPNGSTTVIVLDKNSNVVAEYTKVAGFDNILSINEYDMEGNLLKFLPPAYHQKMNTFTRTSAWNFGEENLSQDEMHWQKILGTHFRYNELNQLIMKATPDTGRKGYMYDPMGNIRFMYNIKSTNESSENLTDFAEKIIYILNIGRNLPVEVGYISETLPVTKLESYVNITSPIPGSIVHQKISYFYSHADPELRNKLKMFLTYNENTPDFTITGLQPPHQELLKFDDTDRIVMKTSNAIYSQNFTKFIKQYKGGKLRELQLPVFASGEKRTIDTGFNLIFLYDKLDNLKSIGSRPNPIQFAQFSYNAAGQIQEATLEPETLQENKQIYTYDSPGHLQQIQDNFITQTISFIEGGYGQKGFGDGIVTQSFFNSSWSHLNNLDSQQRQWFRIPFEDFENEKLMTMCLIALKRLEIIDQESSIPLQFLTESMIIELPQPCGGSLGYRLQKLVAQYIPMSAYFGHKFAYGSHRELMKAKYFASKEVHDSKGPFQIQTILSEIEEISDVSDAQDIWEILANNSFIIVDNGRLDDKFAAIGKQGSKSIFAYAELSRDLAQIENTATAYLQHIMQLLYDQAELGSHRLPVEKFQNKFVEWHGYFDMPTPLILKNRAEAAALQIYYMLLSKGYLGNGLVRLLDPTFVDALSTYNHILEKLAKTLYIHFKCQIGTNIYDYESYQIDPNGNPLMFYAGFHRHRLEYKENTNQVIKLIVQDPYELPGRDETVYEIQHDTQGNVCTAPHRGIERITYHPVTNRPVLMELTDGRKLTFKYDAQGERVLKRVFDASMALLSEVKYLRDEHGVVLMDKRTEFDKHGNEIQQLMSTYIYGPRKTILGFIRNGKFYCVITDHAGSPRLITHKGRVVAGYDYWSYGEMVKSFGDEDAQIMYRFTGQEFDSETGLYNYHARMYDPMLGRFLQPDPKSQYFSPYVYAGNSPVSMIDPDGEFSWEFIIGVISVVTAIVGAYLGGAAANGSFNPIKWNWLSLETWQAIITGGIIGYMLPGQFAALAAETSAMLVLVAGLKAAYFQMVAQNGSYNPLDWDWTNPATYNAFLVGFASAFDIGKLDMNVEELSTALSKTGQKIFISASAVAAQTTLALWKGTLLTGASEIWKWNFKDPALISSLLDGFSNGIGLPEQGQQASKQFAKLIGKNDLGKQFEKLRFSDKKIFQDILADQNHILFESLGRALVAHVMGVYENNDLDITKLNWESISTYEGFLNGLKMGIDINNMYNTYHDELSGIRTRLKSAEIEVKQQIGLADFVRQFAETLNALTEIYLPIANNVLNANLPEYTNTTNVFAGAEFEQQMRSMLARLQAGYTVVPTSESGLENLVECVIWTGIQQPFSDFSICNIANKYGKKSLQNHELIHKLFLPTRLYQSKTEFLKVANPNQSEEFVDTFQSLLATTVESHWLVPNFISSMLIGSVYNSLLSTASDSTTHLFLPSELPISHLPVVHVAQISEISGKKTLTIRSVFLLAESEFISRKDEITSEFLNSRYECYLPENLSQIVENIQGEILAIVTTSKEIQTHIMTPNYSSGSEPCPFIPTKLIPIQNPQISLVESFHRVHATHSENVDELSENFETFLRDLLSEFNNMIHQSGFNDASLEGFATGFIAANTKVTYSLYLKAFFSAGFVALSMIPKRRGNGQEISNGVPMLIHFGGRSPANDRRFMFHAALKSTRSKGMIGSINVNDNIQVQHEELPNFGDIAANLLSENSLKIESLIHLLYYGNQITSSLLPISTTENVHFISNFFLGEFLSKMGDDFVETYAYVPNGNNEERLKAQRIFFVRNANDTKAAVFNIIESSIFSGDNFHFNDAVSMDVPSIPNVEISQLILCELKLNINSASGWALDEMPSGSQDSQAFFQGLTCRSVSPTRIPKDTTTYLKLEPSNQSTGLPPRLHFGEDFIAQMFQSLKENRIQKLLNTNLDFHSVVKGLLVGTANQILPDIDGIKLALRQIVADSNSNFPDMTPMILASILKNGQPLPQTEQVLLSSLHSVNTAREAVIDLELEGAKESIRAYYCQNKERVSQVLKLTKVPAVYNTVETQIPENMERVKFETDPDSLSNITCDSTENHFKSFAYQYSGNPKTESKPEPKPQQNHGSTKLDGCHLGAWVDGQYSLDGISCNSTKFRVSVFKKIGQGDVVTQTARGLPFTLVGDNYKKETCKPIEFNGHPSVACEGEKTTLVYSPYREPRLFDRLDGNLMLGRVFLNMGAKIWNFVRENGWKGRNAVDESHLLSDSIWSEWKFSMSIIHKLLHECKNQQDIVWAKAQMEDIEEQIEIIEENGMKVTPEKIEDISEQLEALQEDISEQILYTNIYEMFGKQNPDQYKNENTGLPEGSSSSDFYNNLSPSNLQNYSFSGSKYFTQYNGRMKTN